MPISLRYRKGCIVASFQGLPACVESTIGLVPPSARLAKAARDGENEYHVTITTPDETSRICLSEDTLPQDANDVVILGVAHLKRRDCESWSAVVLCPSWQRFRASQGLPEKDFHLTLGFHQADPHSPSSSYLLQSMLSWTATYELSSQFFSAMKANNNFVAEMVGSSGTNFPLVLAEVSAIMERLFDLYASDRDFDMERLRELGKLAMQWKAYTVCGNVGWCLLQSGYLFGLRLVLTCMVHSNGTIDMDHLKARFPIDISPTLKTMDAEKVWKNLVELNKMVLARGYQRIDKCLVFGLKDKHLELLSLPRNFSWVTVPGEAFEDDSVPVDKFLLAGCAFPGNADQMLAMFYVGIRRIITIHEGPLPQKLQITPHSMSFGKTYPRVTEAAEKPLQMEFTHIACADRTPPSRRQVQEEVIPVMHQHVAQREGVLVHCLGGLGRTNTLLIAYLMYLTKQSAAEATAEVTRQRRIILSESQKGFLREWYRMVGQGFSWAEHKLSAPSVGALESSTVQGSTAASAAVSSSALPVEMPSTPSMSLRDYQKLAQALKLPPVLMLCGLPASGKSTFAKALVAEQPEFFIRVNRDEMRGKGEVDRALAAALQPYLKTLNSRKAPATTRCIVIDNCHVTATKRREWLEAVHRLPTLCVYFDRPVDVCKLRVSQRLDHPTIPAGTAGIPIIESMVRQWERPELSEGFAGVHRLTTDDEMAALLRSWKVPFVAPSAATLPAVSSSDAVHGGSEGSGSEGEDDEEGDAGAGQASTAMDNDKPIKFPRTAHALNLGAATRDDKVLPLSDLNHWINQRCRLLIEEKVDGANIGFHIRGSDHRIIAQNRSHYISSHYHPQFAPLDKWIAKHTEDLWELLEPDRTILYGEWLYATHSVYYDALPDYFIAYDLYDVVTKTFLPREELAVRIARTKLHQVPLIYEGIVESQDHLRALVNGTSEYGAPKREGIVIRLCDENKVVARAKLVRPDFIAGNERWNRSSKLQTNQLCRDCTL